MWTVKSIVSIEMAKRKWCGRQRTLPQNIFQQQRLQSCVNVLIYKWHYATGYCKNGVWAKLFTSLSNLHAAHSIFSIHFMIRISLVNCYHSCKLKCILHNFLLRNWNHKKSHKIKQKSLIILCMQQVCMGIFQERTVIICEHYMANTFSLSTAFQ